MFLRNLHKSCHLLRCQLTVSSLMPKVTQVDEVGTSSGHQCELASSHEKPIALVVTSYFSDRNTSAVRLCRSGANKIVHTQLPAVKSLVMNLRRRLPQCQQVSRKMATSMKIKYRTSKGSWLRTRGPALLVNRPARQPSVSCHSRPMGSCIDLPLLSPAIRFLRDNLSRLQSPQTGGQNCVQTKEVQVESGESARKSLITGKP